MCLCENSKLSYRQRKSKDARFGRLYCKRLRRLLAEALLLYYFRLQSFSDG